MGKLTATPPEHLPDLEYPARSGKIGTWFLTLDIWNNL